MPASYDIEALKAQAVVARTYTIYKIKNGSKHENADICDNSLCCQAWISKENRLARWEENVREANWNKIEEAVNSTKGKYVTYNCIQGFIVFIFSVVSFDKFPISVLSKIKMHNNAIPQKAIIEIKKFLLIIFIFLKLFCGVTSINSILFFKITCNNSSQKPSISASL